MLRIRLCGLIRPTYFLIDEQLAIEVLTVFEAQLPDAAETIRQIRKGRLNAVGEMALPRKSKYRHWLEFVVVSALQAKKKYKVRRGRASLDPSCLRLCNEHKRIGSCICDSTAVYLNRKLVIHRTMWSLTRST